ncbi:MAG: phosphatidylglycerophosphatase A [Acidobacteria bacterium]|nr:MAG: phosphatidylglycerophosphatase A [Acidobacteriota bacterium]
MTTEKKLTPAVWVASVAGIGYFPFAPGTVGSAVGIAIVAALDGMPVTNKGRNTLLVLAAALIFIVGVWAAGQSEKFFGRTDPGHVVIDEVVGQMVTFLLVPHASWKLLLAGFGLFRVFDVTKPFPVSRAERLPGGWGIMVDDVFAGVYAMLALALLGYIVR